MQLTCMLCKGFCKLLASAKQARAKPAPIQRVATLQPRFPHPRIAISCRTALYAFGVNSLEKTMPAKDNEMLGEFEAAMLLPENEHTTMLHKYAAEHRKMLKIDVLESALVTAQLMRQRWEQDLPMAGSEGFKPFVGSREGARMCVLTESLHGKLVALRNRSYRFARAAMWRHHGVRIDFPTSDEIDTAMPEAPAKPMRAIETAPPPAAPVETPAAPAEDRLVAKRDVKAAMQTLHNRGVKGAEIQAFKKRCLAGNVTESQMREWMQNLMAGARAA